MADPTRFGTDETGHEIIREAYRKAGGCATDELMRVHGSFVANQEKFTTEQLDLLQFGKSLHKRPHTRG
jgi:hypothetical protein